MGVGLAITVVVTIDESIDVDAVDGGLIEVVDGGGSRVVEIDP